MTWSQISLVQKKGKKKERKATGGETNRKNLDVLIPLNLIHLHLKLCLPYFDGWIICFAYGKFFWVNFEFRSPLPQETWSWNYSLIFFFCIIISFLELQTIWSCPNAHKTFSPCQKILDIWSYLIPLKTFMKAFGLFQRVINIWSFQNHLSWTKYAQWHFG